MTIPNPEHWFCIIGPANRKQLPDGADGPLRTAAKNAAYKMLPDNDLIVSSGWGMSDAVRELVISIIIRSLSDKQTMKINKFVEQIKPL